MNRDKTRIKYLFACKYSRRLGAVDISLLTSSNQYVEYTLDFKSSSLTRYVGKRIRSLFEPYVIDNSTDIMVNTLLDERHPLYLYFMLLKQHIGFKLARASIEKIVNRIHYFYTRKTATKLKFNGVWKMVVESGSCPWITQRIDYQLQNKGQSMASRVKMSRLSMFYIVVKNHLYKTVKKSREKQASLKPIGV